MLEEGSMKWLSKQVQMFEHAAAYAGRPRERIIALGEAEEAYFRLYPHYYRALQTLRVASQLGRLVPGQRDPAQKCESRLIAILMGVILDGLDCGDLKLRERQRPTELAFTLWSLAFGTRALMDTVVASRQLGIDDGFRVTRDSTSMLLDAIGWHPLSTDWDYSKTREHIRQGLFAKEWSGAHEPHVIKTA